MKYKWCQMYFKHKWVYSFTINDAERKELRSCSRCGCIEDYRKNVPGFGSGWYLLVMRTKKGAEKFLKELS